MTITKITIIWHAHTNGIVKTLGFKPMRSISYNINTVYRAGHFRFLVLKAFLFKDLKTSSSDNLKLFKIKVDRAYNL